MSRYSPEIVGMMDNTKNCLCCGISLKHQFDKNKRRNRGYCSLACYSKVPPRLAWIQQVTGKPARRALLDMLNTGATWECVAGQLCCERAQLGAYIKRLGIKREVRYV